jgi:hypothetical protein
MDPPTDLIRMVELFRENLQAYQSDEFNEAALRLQFIDPLFELLGWDVYNRQGYAEAYKDVVHEDSLKIGAPTKAPDYSFRIRGTRRFFVEAKRPAVKIKQAGAPAFQLRRYAWSAKLPLSILTNFEELAVYDCRVRPEKNDSPATARTMYVTFDQYAERWAEITAVFSREAVLKGSFDKYAESAKRKRGTAEVDAAFLEEIESWRSELARNMAIRNPDLPQRELNVAVQKTIDRIIFLRMCEDRGIEPYGRLQPLLNGPNVYARLGQLFREADDRYNSGLFHFLPEKGRYELPDEWTLDLAIDDGVLKEIVRKLYYPESPYEFSVLPADILGQVYEQFLGKVIRLTPGHRAVVEDKPEVKKAGGVYYTPTYIVDYIVRNTVGQRLEGKTAFEAAARTSTWKPAKGRRPLSVLDPACGSGSFLIGAYQFLLDWYRDWFIADGPARHKHRVYQTRQGQWRLTTAERKRILLDHIYGVDIDPQAVEVTKLSLLLKVLEAENKESLELQRRMFHERALPDLAANIKCGNSLIGPDFYRGQQMDLFDDDARLRINVFDWDAEFAQIMPSGGFDAVIGNPPYVRMELFAAMKDYLREHYESHEERADLYSYFVERALRLLNPTGCFGMIVSNKFIRAKYGRPLRRVVGKLAKVTRLTDFAGANVFVGATVRTIVLTATICTKSRVEPEYVPAPDPETLAAISEGRLTVDEHAEASKVRLGKRALSADEWRLIPAAHSRLLSRLQDSGQPLSRHYQIRAIFGLKTGLNDAFVIDGATKELLEKSDPKSQEVLKPILFGRDVRRYFVSPADRFVIYCHPNVEIRDYPAIERHLALFRQQLTKRAGPQQWFELQQPATALLPIVERPKIVYPIIANQCRFVIDEDGYLVNDKMFVLPLSDRTLVGVLNSRVANFYFASVCAALEGSRDRYLEFRAQYVDPFPIPAGIEKASSELASLVDQIHRLHKRRSRVRLSHERTALQRQIEATDREIDRLVYELYGLTEKEIRIVEEATEPIVRQP